MIVLRVLTLCALATVLSAQGLSGGQYITCECSGSNRGFRISVYNQLNDNIMSLIEEERNLVENQVPAVRRTRELAIKAATLWDSCVDNYSAEECVNADTALRFGASCRPKCASFCFFNPGTFKTIANGKLNADCDTSKQFATEEQELINRTADNTEVRNSATNPNPGAPGIIPRTTPRPQTNVPPPTEPESGATDATGAGNQQEPPPTRRTAEGCVAIEHLQGYVLQHSRNLWRPVLCARGFCATPNHAIIVDGEWTSMKRLCARDWQCVRTVKLVNNLKAAANRRAVVNGYITVTPYDLRFPRVAVLVVQRLEDLVNFLGFFGVSAAVLGLLVGVKALKRV